MSTISFRPLKLAVWLGILLLLASAFLRAQVTLDSIGVPPSTQTFPVEHGLINLNNGYLHLEIPLENYAQRGDVQDQLTLTYDSRIWTALNPCTMFCGFWAYAPGLGGTIGPIGEQGSLFGGWQLLRGRQQIVATGRSGAACKTGNTGDPAEDYTSINFAAVITWTDSHGTAKVFPDYAMAVPPSLVGCAWTDGKTYVDTPTSTSYATDGSGYSAVVTNYTQIAIYDPKGTQVGSSVTSAEAMALGQPVIIDRNGNYLPPDGTDTLGRTLVTDTVADYNGNYPKTEYLDIPVANGGTARYTLHYKFVPTGTQFNWVPGDQYCTIGPGVVDETCAGQPLPEYTAPIYVIDSLVLPDGSSYAFTYEGSYAELSSITLPHGGVESFTYANSAPTTLNGEFVTPARHIASHGGADGNTTFAWSVNGSSPYQELGVPCGQVNNVVTTSKRQSTYTFSFCNDAITPQRVEHRALNESIPTAIELFNYDLSVPCPVVGAQPACSGALYRNKIAQTTVIPQDGTRGLTSDVQYSYGVPGVGIPTVAKEWDYVGGTYPTTLPDSPPSIPTRETDQTLNYVVNNAAFPTEVKRKDATGAVLSDVTYTYDESAYFNASTPASTPSHNNRYAIGNRGNLTTINRCCGVSATGALVPSITHMFYDGAGSVTKVLDPNGNLTSFAYDATDTFPTTITSPQTSSGGTSVSHQQRMTNDPATGQLTSITDQNQQTLSFTFDTVGRPFTTAFSNGSSPVTLKTVTYPSPNETDVTQLLSDGVSTTSSTIVDGYGRTTKVSQGGISVETSYDGSGQVFTISNPHSSVPGASDGVTTYTYDELGRSASVKIPGGGKTTYQYSGNTVTVTDPLSQAKTFASDAFGDLVMVIEPDLTGKLNWSTIYSYDAASRMTQVDQKGGSSDPAQWRSRYFRYDGLGRTISQSTPEAGASTFTYDYNGNLTQSVNASPSNNTTSYGYDAANRLISKTVAGGKKYMYTYDAADNSGDLFGHGRMTSISDGGSVQTTFTHDALGNVTSMAFCLPSSCTFNDKVATTYDYSGNVTSMTYPDGRRMGWVYDHLGRPTASVYSSWNASPVNLPVASNMTYSPAGQLMQTTLGNGVQMGATYDANLNVSSLAYVAKGTPITMKTYTWDLNAANLLAVTDFASGRSQSYSYDPLSRIASATDSGSTSSACVAGLPNIPASSETYTIDSWGNLTQSGNWSFIVGYDAKNRIATNGSGGASGYSYDNSGNLTSDYLGNSYSYQSDGLLANSSGATYTYDAFGQRVRKDAANGGTEYIYVGGQLLATRNVSTGAWTDRIYGPTGAIAFAPGTQNAGFTYRLTDHLGSVTHLTDSQGAIAGAAAILPFGQQVTNSTNDLAPFTDHEQDTENSTYHTLYRQLSITQGRWTSPDPYSGSYNLGDPQSLNRYAYAANRPMKSVDSTGLCDDGDDSCDDGSDPGATDDGSGDSWQPSSGPPPDYSMGGFDYSFGPGNVVDANIFQLSPGITGVAASTSDAPPVNSLFGAGTGLPVIGLFSRGSATTVSNVYPAAGGQRSGYESLFCLGDALRSNGLSLALDTVGLIPEAEGFTKVYENLAGYQLARKAGNALGYQGIVATQQGSKAIRQAKGAVSMGAYALGAQDTSVKGMISTGATLAGFIPVLSTYAAGVSIGLDLSNINDGQSACVASGRYN